jgi:hypothetical protein
VGAAYGPGGIGALLQAELGEAITVAIKPNRVQVIGPGDTLAVLAARYSTTIEALRQVNPEPPLPGKMTPLQPDHVQPPGGLMEQSNASVQRDGQS